MSRGRGKEREVERGTERKKRVRGREERGGNDYNIIPYVGHDPCSNVYITLLYVHTHAYTHTVTHTLTL